MKLFVFDLDFTLWDAGGTWCDATNPPYYWKDGVLLDQSNSIIELYPDVIPVLEELKRNNRKIAAASRTFEPTWAQDLLHLFDIDKYFDLKEIYPSSKIQHFAKIKKHFGFDYSDMVFFDDEHRNIHEVGKLGVEAVLVNDGIDKNKVLDYLK
ncbi:magnesium-dependent phosphatase-1 [Draconibacterium sp. IB214405]|uniref:magnesium-dependent phosphatase-1 n=1 Tax=Draconibacterium sp. IB214405 TaxID=3097352 RepID=UPI002A0CDD3D|nr:magnesium-dependent phosphatase-1 [Draconibacterium sp. IB214405]MDX8340251.1 magnesium-dependent phosphatase-1 [Draconibacterium sp. IB214405]